MASLFHSPLRHFNTTGLPQPVEKLLDGQFQGINVTVTESMSSSLHFQTPPAHMQNHEAKKMNQQCLRCKYDSTMFAMQTDSIMFAMQTDSTKLSSEDLKLTDLYNPIKYCLLSPTT
jgi:hypothetical protein